MATDTGTKMHSTKRKVTDETFCKVWTLAASVDDVAAKTGLAKHSAQGVRLKKMHQRHPIEVAALNALIASCE